MVTQRQRQTEDVGLRVDVLRTECGVTVQHLSNVTKIPYATLLRRLAGDGQLTVSELRRISEALGVSPASWFQVAA